MFELEQYPQSVINEYKALNIVSPFTNDSELVRQGVQLSFIRNQNVTKKQHIKTAEDILPYLSEYPEYLEHPTIKKLNELLAVCQSEELKDDLLTKILEEIEIESDKPSPDTYLLTRLSEIYSANRRG